MGNNREYNKEQLLCSGPEAIGIMAITMFFVLFPLAGVAVVLISYMIKASWPVWATILLGIISIAVAITIWLTIVGFILGKLGSMREK